MNKYQQALEPIRVTPEIRERVLETVTRRVLYGSARKSISFRRYGALAACLAVLLLGVLVVPKLTEITTEPPVQGGSPLTDVTSLEALEAAVGFPIKTPHELPFTPSETTYTYIDTGLAQVLYVDGEQSACWRQSLGSEDVSGDYNVYDAQTILEWNGQKVMLKGYGDSYALAVWNDGTCSYALSLSEQQGSETWESILNSIS